MGEDPEIQSLQDKINAARGLKNVEIKKKPGTGDANSRAGAQAGIELVVAIFAGGFIGYWIDQWLGTQPAFMIILFFLGVATGFYNVYRLTQNLGTAVGQKKADNLGLSAPEKDAKTTPENKN